MDDLGQSVVMVTHEPEAAAWADTVLFLRDGHVVAELGEPDRDSVLDALRVLGEGAGPLVAQEAASVPRGRDGADAGQGEGRGSYQRPGA